MQQSWYNESQKLMDQIASLETENQRLKLQLENVNASGQSAQASQPSLSGLVSGKEKQRPPNLAIKPEVDVIIAQTEERLSLVQQESRLLHTH